MRKMMKKGVKAVLFLGFIGMSSMLMFGLNADAYIDPSVMTYLIQVVAGIVIAVGAAAGIHVRRMKKKLSDKLGIDENRNKEVESDDIIVDEEEK